MRLVIRTWIFDNEKPSVVSYPNMGGWKSLRHLQVSKRWLYRHQKHRIFRLIDRGFYLKDNITGSGHQEVTIEP